MKKWINGVVDNWIDGDTKRVDRQPSNPAIHHPIPKLAGCHGFALYGRAQALLAG
jgi:hypothetical protein